MSLSPAASALVSLASQYADVDLIGAPSEGIMPPCETYRAGDPCACGMH